MAYGGESPLEIATLRGGRFIDDQWLLSPAQPTICLSTVDQVGSRMLFRGYGVSPYQWPIHAGLVTNDTSLIIDEAHLSEPLTQTLNQVALYRKKAEFDLQLPFTTTVMSATQAGKSDITLSEADRSHPVLSRRLQSKKLASLEMANEKSFCNAMLKHAEKLSKSKNTKIVGVITNRVDSAREIFEALKKKMGESVILLTGRMRPYDKDHLLDHYRSLLSAGDKSRSTLKKPLIVVATQTIEVGANIDFDALVTECAPLDALRQRFGRLDRLGDKGNTKAVIVLRKYSRGKPDPVYGVAPTETFQWLDSITEGDTTKPCVDFGIQAMDKLIDTHSEQLPKVSIQNAPVLLPAYLDLWVQTCPRPTPEPDIEPFLRGEQRASTDVYLVWRADLPDDLSSADSASTLAIVQQLPPMKREALAVPIYAVRQWLQGFDSSPISDIEGAISPNGNDEGNGRIAIRWRGNDSDIVDAASIRPGDTLVIPSSYGGADQFGWHPASSAHVTDIAENCLLERLKAGLSKRLCIRLHGNLIRQWHLHKPEELLSSLTDIHEHMEINGLSSALREGISTCLEELERQLDNNDIIEIIKKLQGVTFSIDSYPNSTGLYLMAGSELLFDDTADTTSHTSPVSLESHLEGVSETIRQFGELCGLPADLINDLALAGRLHDLGKAEPRFQTMLYNGDCAASIAGGLRAKSGNNTNNRRMMKSVYEASGVPSGFRHELVSVALLNNSPEYLAGNAYDSALVTYLVGVHHGRSRALVAPVRDDSPTHVNVSCFGHTFQASSHHGLERLDSGWVDIFWQQIRRYGWWQLAYLEALVRLGDWARSRREAEK